MTTTSRLAYSPLTDDELFERKNDARMRISAVVEVVVKTGGLFRPYDLDRLRELGAVSSAYGAAVVHRLLAREVSP